MELNQISFPLKNEVFVKLVLILIFVTLFSFLLMTLDKIVYIIINYILTLM